MAEKTANPKTVAHAARAEPPAPSAGPDGGVLAPPAYGIDFLDRDPGEGRRGGLMIQRKAEPAAGATTPPNASYPTPTGAAALTLSPSASFEEIVDVMRVIDKIKPSANASGVFTTAYQSKEITLSSKDVETVRAAARGAMSSALTRSINRRNQAVARYQGQEETNRGFPLTSRAVKVYAWISSFGGYANPGEAVDAQSAIVTQEAALAQAALANGTFAEAVYHVSAVDAASERAGLMVQAYIDQLIAGGGRMEAGLTFTRNAAFITVGVLATIISGGAALGLGAEVVGTGIGGLTVAETATVVSVGAPILANVGSAAIQTAEGDHVDWGKVVVDTVVQVLLAKFGGELTAGIAGKLAGNPATQTLARQAIATLGSNSATHVITQAFTATVSADYEILRGKQVTWQQLLDTIIESLSDPVGWFMVALGSGVHLGAQVKANNALKSQAATSERSSTPAKQVEPVPPALEPEPVSQPKPIAPAQTSEPAELVSSAPPQRMGTVTADAQGYVEHPPSTPKVEMAPQPRSSPKAAGATQAPGAEAPTKVNQTPVAPPASENLPPTSTGPGSERSSPVSHEPYMEHGMVSLPTEEVQTPSGLEHPRPEYDFNAIPAEKLQAETLPAGKAGTETRFEQGNELTEEQMLANQQRHVPESEREAGSPGTARVGESETRTGMHYKEYNAAETALNLRTSYSPEHGGYMRSVEFDVPERVGNFDTRPDKFTQEKLMGKVGIDTPTHDEYTKSGYERGHGAAQQLSGGDPDVAAVLMQTSNVWPMKGMGETGVNQGVYKTFEDNYIALKANNPGAEVHVKIEAVVGQPPQFVSGPANRPILSPDAFDITITFTPPGGGPPQVQTMRIQN